MTVPEQPARKLVHTSHMPVRWGDMDAFGHVNNTVYFRYMEQARIEWFASICDVDSTLDTGPVLINTQCSFFIPLKYPDQLEVQLYIDSPGRSSIETIYQIYRLGGDKALCAEGSGKVVWVDRAVGKSTPLPDLILNQFR